MAKYTNGYETVYECEKCQNHFERHHFSQPDGSLKCPECDCPTFFHYDKCEVTDEMELIGFIGGVFRVAYQGLDKIPSPVVVCEEQQWMPMECPLCNLHAHMIDQPNPIHFVHRVKFYDATRAFSLSDTPMYGRDIVQGGSQIVFPFMEPSRVWVDGELINLSKYRNPDVGGWEYFL